MSSKVLQDVIEGFKLLPSIMIGTLKQIPIMINKLKNDPNDFVDYLQDGLNKIDLGGEEIYYMFIGGIIFIILSHILNILSPLISKILFPIWIFDYIIIKLTQITLFVIFCWFIIAFMAFLWVIFIQKDATNNKEPHEISNQSHNKKE